MTPTLTDHDRLARNRARARAMGFERALHDRAIDEVQERLNEVNRAFTAPAVVTGMPEFWSRALPGATMVADHDRLDLAPGAHDCVIHGIALHWADDPVGQLVQCRLALRPDGLFLALFPGGRTLNELRTVLAEAESRLAGGLAPRVAPMAELRDLGGLLQRAGFAMPVADATRLDLTYPSLRALLRDLRRSGEGNALASRDPRPMSRAVLRLAEELYAEHFPAPGGRIAATLDLVALTGWAPAADQPKPLRPGSASHRLAEVLGVAETTTGERALPEADRRRPAPGD